MFKNCCSINFTKELILGIVITRMAKWLDKAALDRMAVDQMPS